MKRFVGTLVCLASFAGSAAAEDTTAPAAAPMTPTPSASTAVPAPMAPPSSGPRLRNGFSLSLGQELGSGPSDGLSGQLYGVDWRIGAKINGAVSVYADTHLSLGTAKIEAISINAYEAHFLKTVLGGG